MGVRFQLGITSSTFREKAQPGKEEMSCCTQVTRVVTHWAADSGGPPTGRRGFWVLEGKACDAGRVADTLSIFRHRASSLCSAVISVELHLHLYTFSTALYVLAVSMLTAVLPLFCLLKLFWRIHAAFLSILRWMQIRARQIESAGDKAPVPLMTADSSVDTLLH